MRKFTERVKKVQQVNTSNSHSSLMGLWGYDIITKEFKFDNEFLTLLGYNEYSNKGIPLNKLCSIEHQNNFNKEISLSFENNAHIKTEIMFFKKDGTPYWAYLTGLPDKTLLLRNRRFSGVLLDINKIKETDLEIQRKNEELEALYEEAEAQNEELAAMMDELSENQILIEESNIKLQISEYKYRNIFENAPFGIMQFSSEGEILNINSKFKSIFELPDNFSNVIDMFFLNSLFENRSIPESILSLQESTPPVSFTNEKGTSLNKRIIPINIKAKCTNDSFSGESLYTIFIEDISKLKSSQFERDLLFNNSTDLLLITDLEGNIKQINPAWKTILNMSADDVKRIGARNIVHNDDWEDAKKFFSDIAKLETHCHLACKILTKDGQIKIINWTGIGYADLGLVFISGRDETERLKAESELRKMWDRLDIATRNGVIGLWDFDLKSNVLILNKSMSELLGYKSSIIEDPGRNWFSRIHKEDLENINIATKMHLKGEKEFYMSEYRFSLPDGTYRWMLSRGKISEWDRDNKPIRISGSITDITDQKETEANKLKIEKKMQQAQKLESLGILAGGIAHDFNNILQGILGNTDLLIKSLPKKSQFIEELMEIKKSTLRATELTTQMLAYTGRGTFVFKPLNINKMLNDMKSLISVSVSKKAEITYNADDNIPDFSGDITQIRQIIMNIVSNSSDSLADKPGKIKIITGYKDLTKQELEALKPDFNIPEGQYVFITISDNGNGIPETNLNKIFDPFFSTKFAGRGLGLAAVQGIIKSHGGALEVISSEERGTDFTIYFPVKETVSMKKNSDGPLNAKFKYENQTEKTILIVDDEKHILDLAVKILNLSGYKTLTAANGKEGISVFKENKNKVSSIIMDMTMPDLDGDEAIAEILKISPDVPIIVSSGYSEVDINKKFKDLEGMIFLHKPYLVDDLINAVTSSLNLN